MMRRPGGHLTIIDDADKRNYIPDPQHNPVHYGDGRIDQFGKHKMNWRALLLGALGILCMIVSVIVVLGNFLRYRYIYNDNFRNIVDISVNAIIAFISLGICLCILSLVIRVFSWAVKAGLFEIPGGMVASVWDILLDWRRSNTASVAKYTLDKHFQVQMRLADKSKFRNVTSFAPGYSYHYNNRSLPMSDQEAHIIDMASFDSVIPSFADLVSEGAINENPDEFILGYEVLENE